MSLLFTPLKLKNLILANRIVVSPMCQYSAIDGFANDWHVVHLGQFAIGKAALVIQEATAVTPDGRISYGDLGLWKDEHIKPLKAIVDFVHSQGRLIGIQLAHAGRKASTEKPWISRDQIKPNQHNGWQTMAPSAIPYHEQDFPPVSLSKEAIIDLVNSFKHASERAVKAGYDIVELHGAHGYLIHQFLSPLTNLRTDEYGGSFDNRIRFLLEIIDAIIPVLQQQSLWLRISATDWVDGGWSLQDSIQLIDIVKTRGIEVVDVSSGGAVKQQDIPVRENYQVPFAQRIKEESAIVTGTVGLIKTAQQAEKILQLQQADFVLIGRGFLQNPHLVYQFANELGLDISWPHQYARAKENL